MKKNFGFLVLALYIVLQAHGLCYCTDFYPTGMDLTWTYEGYMKSEPAKKLNVVASIVSVEKVGGKEYYYYSAPSVDVRYFVRKDDKWGYMKLIKYPFPVLKFLTVDVYLEPEIKFIKFPYRVGDEWEQLIEAEAVLKPFKMKLKIKVKFNVLDSEKFIYDGKEYEAFHVRLERHEGNGTVRIEDNWFAEDLGFVKGETPEYTIQLKNFSQKPCSQ
ncbi:MAG: hypothetical protein LLG37_10200 [Spirochaetia bacterium]|nr:hypothetical protein [Spirochaetia bacterium]